MALDWRKKSGTSHSRRMTELLKNERGYQYDVTFLVGPKREEVKAHQSILSIHSAVFEQKFKDQKHLHPRERIHEGTKHEFEQFLEFVYTGVFPEPAQASTLLDYAVQFKVAELEEWCWEILEKITEQSAVTTYELAAKYRKDILRYDARRFILRKARTILDSAEFLKLTSRNLMELLESDELTATDETQVFKALLRWGNDQCKRMSVRPPDPNEALKMVLRDLVPLIRFPTMNRNDFKALVAPPKVLLLTKDQKTSLLSYLNATTTSERNKIYVWPFNTKKRRGSKVEPLKRKPKRQNPKHPAAPNPHGLDYYDPLYHLIEQATAVVDAEESWDKKPRVN